MGTAAQKCVIIGFVALAASGLAATAMAAAPPKVADLPEASPVPVGKGKPYAVNPLIDTTNTAIKVAEFGYVEDEYIVSGKANVYQYGPSGTVEVLHADTPYTTRIVVRKPKDRERFSGIVHVEGGPALDGFAWHADAVIKRGDAWVSVNTHGLRQSVEPFQKFDPVRYAALKYPEWGQNWDIMSEVGRLLKSDAPQSPFHGYAVRRVLANGWSGSASIWWFFINEGFHKQVRMPDSSPIYDGYLVGEPSGYSPLNGALPPSGIAKGDKRWTVVVSRDVPVIVLHSGPQPLDRRRADSDDPNDRYRVYEIAGANHGNLRVSRAYHQPASVFDVAGPFGCELEISRFPFNFYVQSTLARLVAWVDKGVVPPPSVRVEINADGTAKKDQFGNDIGGVRSTYLDMPLYSYVPNKAQPKGLATCNGEGSVGGQTKLPADKIKALYKDRTDYVNKVTQRSKELEREGWLLPADAADIRKEVAQLKGL